MTARILRLPGSHDTPGAPDAPDAGRAGLMAAVQTATALEQIRKADLAREPTWGWDLLAGCLSEVSTVSGGAAVSLAFAVLGDAQQKGETAAWIHAPGGWRTGTRRETSTRRRPGVPVAGRRPGSFFPPDAAASGLDLAALAVVRVGDPADIPRVADQLVRSGGFGAVVLDLGADAELPMPLQSRLVQLARKHDTAVLCLTRKEDDVPSLGSLVALRASARRVRRDAGRLVCEAHVQKDKRRGPGWSAEVVCRGPQGLR